MTMAGFEEEAQTQQEALQAQLRYNKHEHNQRPRQAACPKYKGFLVETQVSCWPALGDPKNGVSVLSLFRQSLTHTHTHIGLLERYQLGT